MTNYNEEAISLKKTGLSAEHSVLHHLAKENTYESNLISDISNVCYTEHAKEKTKLKPLAGLPPFLDDTYVFGYAPKKDTYKHRNGRPYIKGDVEGKKATGPAALYLNNIKSIFAKHLGQECNVIIAFSLSFYSTKLIMTEIKKIEERTDYKVLNRWKKCNEEEENPHAAFKCKIDTSNIPFNLLFSKIGLIEEELNISGYGLFSIDYTQDFSGVLHKKELEDFLRTKKHFRISENEKPPVNFSEENKKFWELLPILEKTDNTAGGNIVKYYYYSNNGKSLIKVNFIIKLCLILKLEK